MIFDVSWWVTRWFSHGTMNHLVISFANNSGYAGETSQIQRTTSFWVTLHKLLTSCSIICLSLARQTNGSFQQCIFDTNLILYYSSSACVLLSSSKILNLIQFGNVLRNKICIHHTHLTLEKERSFDQSIIFIKWLYRIIKFVFV